MVEIADERGRPYAADYRMVREDVAALDNLQGDGCARDAAGCGCPGGTPRRGPGRRPEHQGLGSVHPTRGPERRYGWGHIAAHREPLAGRARRDGERCPWARLLLRRTAR
jgi:hypothetical protein